MSDTCREIVTKQRLYERLENEIRKTEITILKEEVRLETLRATKQNLDEYFEDALRVTNCEPNTGHWKNKEFRKEEYVLTGTCSVCGRVSVIDEFCHHCGARMERSDKE